MSQTLQIKELHEQRLGLIEQARAMLETAKRDKRDMNPEEEDKFNLLHDEAERINKLCLRTKKQLDLEARDLETLAEERESERRSNRMKIEPELRKEIENKAFSKYLRGGQAGLSMEERQALQRLEVRASPGDPNPQSTTDAAGGYTIPEDFQRELEAAMLDYSGILQSRARIIRTSTGAPLPWPQYNDTAQAGAILAENAQVTVSDMLFTSTTLDAYMYSSGAILLSYQLIQDSAFDMDGEVRRALGERLGRIINTHGTTGTGSSQPNGVVTGAADSGVDFGLAAIPTYANLLDVYHALDPAYRANAEWMFADAFLKEIRQIEDTAGTLIFQPSLVPGAPDMLLGKPIVINQGMPAPGSANNKSCLFGDFSKYIVRMVTPATVMRLNERYADYLQVGFIGYMRMDADLIDAGTNPIVYGAEAAA